MQQYIGNPKRSSMLPLSSASVSGSPRSPASADTITIQKAQSVSSMASPLSIKTSTGRSYAEPNTPVFSLPYNAGKDVKMSDVNVRTPKLHGVSPTSVASPLAPPILGGIQSGPLRSSGIVGNRLSYDVSSPSSEMVFEPVNRNPPLRGVRSNNIMFCTPCNNVKVTEDDTSEDTSPIASAASITSSSRMPVSLLTLRSSSFQSSTKRASAASRRVSTVPTSSTSSESTNPTPQNLKDNPERLAKVKTEMCRYFETGGLKNCPWGDKCKCIVLNINFIKCILYFIHRFKRYPNHHRLHFHSQ